MGQHNLQLVEDLKMTVDGMELRLSPCRACGSKFVYIHYRRGKYQLACWWDTTCRHRSGGFDTLLEALEDWNGI